MTKIHVALARGIKGHLQFIVYMEIKNTVSPFIKAEMAYFWKASYLTVPLSAQGYKWVPVLEFKCWGNTAMD